MTDLTPHQTQAMRDLVAATPDWSGRDPLTLIAEAAKGMTDAEFDAYLERISTPCDAAQEGDAS